MMTVFRDKQVRLAMLLLYGLAALCLSLAQAEQIFVFNAVPLEAEADRAKVEAIERAHLESLWAECPESE